MIDLNRTNGKPPTEGSPEEYDKQLQADFESGKAPAKQSAAPLWERQAGESAKAYEAFSIYRDMGPDRSQANVGKKLGKSSALMNRWGSQFSWVRRAEAFDIEQDRLYFASLAIKRREMAERHAKEATTLQAVAMAAVRQRFGDRLEKLLDGSASLSNLEILRFFTEAAKLERIALGEPADIVEQQHTGGLADGEQQRSPIALTFSGRIEAAAALLETARTRAAAAIAKQSD